MSAPSPSSFTGFSAQTLLDVLRDAADQTPDCPIIHVRRDGTESRSSHAGLLAAAERVAGGLQATGIAPRTPVLLPIETSDGFMAGFWGALIAGLIPVPLATEPERLKAVWSFLDRGPVLVDAPLSSRLPGLLGTPAESIQTVNVDALSNHDPIAAWYPATPGECAYLQFSSGSTGMPKGVELTHANVMANLEQIHVAAEIVPSDIMVSWLPFFHDMGLVANHLTPLAGQFQLIKMAPLHFAKRPLAWLELATRHRATILSTANFALGLTLRLVKPEQLTNVDLSSVRLLTIGAEPISAELCRRFLDLLGPVGLRPEALTAAYGMAEATVGVSLAPATEPIRTHAVDRARMAETNEVVLTEPGPGAVELVELGFPFRDLQVRIVDEADLEVGERVVGNVQVKGPNVTAGYYRVADNSALFCGDWLRTGDRGFLLDGRLTVTGRAKDVLFVNGRKFHAVDLEETIGRVPGVRPAKVAVVGRHDRETGAERIAVFVATEAAGMEAATPTLRQVRAVAQEAITAPVDDLILLAPGAFPHTTSGKLERYRLRRRLEAGEFDGQIDAIRAAIGEQPTPTVAETIPPRDDLEAAVHAIWADVLRRDPVSFGVTDRFLAIGGTSLQAMEVLGRLESLHGKEIEPATLLDRPTVADLAAWLREGRRVKDRRQSGDRRADTTGNAPVAVIGMACRFPDAETPERFWENLIAGRDSVGEIPRSRWDGDALFDPAGTRPDGSQSRWGSFLDDVAGFDAEYFGIDPDEARAIDPQARILLELAVETLERAGYPSARRRTERVGVFVGVGEVNYQELTLPLLRAGQPVHPSTAVGNLRNLIAGRIANLLDLTGPVVAIDTACSSALVALHQARQSLLSGECDLALVGAVSLNLTPTSYQLLSRAGALSPSGRCRAFDDGADGIVLGEGAGMLLLTRQSRAEQVGDASLAIVRGSAVNNDGRAISLMAPNPFRQQEVIATAYQAAGIDPATVGFVEAHGTGTPIGDPIEARSLAHVFPVPSDGGRRMLGAVKTNLGHLLNACGMPGLMKTVLALQHGHIPPTLHYQRANRRFDIEAAGFTVNAEPVAWPGNGPRRAGVNAFGFGGTNAHVILEQAPDVAPAPAGDAGRPHLVLLSARTEPALAETITDLSVALSLRPEVAADPASIAFSASTARDPFAHRLGLVTNEPLVETLRRIDAGEQVTAVWRGQSPTSGWPRIGFLVSGQGAQYPGQGKLLAEADPIFRETFLRASELAGPIHGRTLQEWCWDEGVGRGELARTDLAQPLLVGFAVALGQMARAWGIEPDAVAGHSVGEIAAACLAGSISLEQAMALAVERGRLMADLPEAGTMSAVFASEEVVQTAIDRRGLSATVSIAAINDPTQTVIAGREADLERLSLDLENQGYRSVPLSVSQAFHSPLMAPMLARFSAYLGGLPAPAAPSVPFLSTVTGDWVEGTALDARYWLEHVSRPVRFSAAVERLAADGIDTFVEIGPGSSLVGMVRNTLRGRDEIAVESLLQRGEHDLQTAFSAAARLWVRGVDLDRRAIEGGQTRRRLALPTYPFQREKYWLPEPPALVANVGAPVAAPARTPDEIDRLLAVPSWIDAPLGRTDRGASGRWLITSTDEQPLVAALLARFRQRGIDAHRVSLPDLRSAITGNDPVAGVLHIAAFGRPEAFDDGDLDARQRALESDLAGVLTLAQGIAQHPAGSRPNRLIVVSSDSARTGPNDRVLAPERAAALGLAGAIGDDLPGIESLAIDLSWQDGLDAAVDHLLTEVLAVPSTGFVAWRGGSRFQRQLRHEPTAIAPVSALRADGLYLIVGGAEGIGAEIARHMAATVRPELVLVGRTALVTSPKRQALIAELERSGARVRYEQVDATDPAAVAAMVERISAQRPIAGVIQAAGIVEPSPLTAKTIDAMRRTLLPKTRALWAMERALRRARQQPDFIVAFSSLSSVLPRFGGFLTDYVAANAFVDAYAGAQSAAGVPFLSINWSAWAETGMSAAPALLERVRANGILPLSTDRAVRAFERAIATGRRGQIAVLDGDPVALSHARERATHPVVSNATTAPLAADFVPVATIGSTSDLAEIEGAVQRLVAANLNVPPADVPIDRSFMTLGLQSLVAVDLVKQLERQSGVTLPTTLFFEYPTIRTLSAYLSTALAQSTVAHAASGQAAVAAPAEPPKTAPFPLTPVQFAFSVTSRLYDDLPTLSLLRETIEGPIETSILLRAFETLIGRHPMLRVRLLLNERAGDAPLQEIVDAAEVIGARERWFEERIGGSDLDRLEEEIANTIFDLRGAPLFRVVLQRVEANRAHLVLVAHHLACDAWSLAILSDELWTIYAALTSGTTPRLPESAATFADYVSAVAVDATTPDAEADRRWWATRMPELNAHRTAFPFDGPAPSVPTPPIRAITSQLTADESARLKAKAAAGNTSVFAILLGIYARTLGRWSESERFVVSVAHGGRHHRLPGIERLVGTCADALPIAVQLSDGADVAGLSGQLQAEWVEALRHPRVSSVELTRMLGTNGSGRPRALGDAIFSFAAFPGERQEAGPIRVAETAGRTGSAAMTLTLLAWEAYGAIGFSWNFPSSLLRAETAEGLAADYLADLHAFIAEAPDPDESSVQGSSASPLISVASGPSEHSTVPLAPEIIRQACQTWADETAIEFRGQALTYHELAERADRLAGALREQGAARNQPVALLTYRGIESLVGIVGSLFAGAPWLPLDPDASLARLTDQIRIAGATILIYERRTEEVAAAVRHALGDLTLVSASDLADVGLAVVTPETSGASSTSVDPDDLAYLIFTSGSTGVPKAVPITHRSLGTYLDWVARDYPIVAGDRTAQPSPGVFDASIHYQLGPLSVGATVVPVPEEIVRDPDALLDFIGAERITVWRGVASVWERMVTAIERRQARGEAIPALDQLRLFTIGGEAMYAANVRRWMDLYGDRQTIINEYGPAEATIMVSMYPVTSRPADDVTRIPIGWPLPTAELVVLDERQRPVAPGETGELAIGGPLLSPGYLGDPALSAELFTEIDGRRWYRTRDLVSQRADGCFEFIGRSDDQVKINGIRIELGEIEAVLAGYPGVTRAAVVKAGDDVSADGLVAFLTTRNGAPAVSDLRAWLRRGLPGYMMPRRFVHLDQLPLTGTDKIDRSALAARSIAPGEVLVEARQSVFETETERIVAAVWAEVLGVPEVGRDDDFFALGGDSIRMLEVLVRLEGQVPAIPRAVTFYRNPTLAGFAAAIDAEGETASVPQTHTTENEIGGAYPVTPTQAGFILTEAMLPGVAQNWCASLIMEGPLDEIAFRCAIDYVVARHPMMRTIFPAGLRPPKQLEVSPDRPLEIPFHDLSGLPSEAARRAALDDLLQQERELPIAIDRWPLLRMRLCKLGPDRHAWVIAAHHLIGDGMSAQVLGQDILSAYDRFAAGESPDLPPLRSTFRDYVELTERNANAPRILAEEHWRTVFAVPYQTPTEWRRPEPLASARSLHRVIDLDAGTLGRLRQRATAQRLTLYPLVLAAYARQLGRLTGRDDLVIGTALSGRDHPLPDITRVFGCFATGVPLRIAAPAGTAMTAIGPESVASVFVNALHHALPPARIARLLPDGMRLDTAIGSQFFFTFVDLSTNSEFTSDILRVHWDESESLYDPPAAGVDLVVAAHPSAHGLRITIEASAAAFTAEMAEELATGIAAELRAMAGDDEPERRSVPIAQNSGAIQFVTQPLASLALPAPDAALIGYLPPLSDITGLLPGEFNTDGLREFIREEFFPSRQPRWMERVETDLGTSAFIGIPWFADELLPSRSDALTADVATAIRFAGEIGARSVSLAGMIPSLTGYGYAVAQTLDSVAAPVLTTGHGTTVASVVNSVAGALDAIDASLTDQIVAFVGLGSIGFASLQLLLDRLDHPRRLILCDAPGSTPRLRELAAILRDQGFSGPIDLVEATPTAPDEVYSATVIVGATSVAGVIDVERLQPGTILVDDSFPACFDHGAGIRRMQAAGDILLTGGGSLRVGPTRRWMHLPDAAEAFQEQIAAGLPSGELASCQLESILRAGSPELPPTLGLVTLDGARAYAMAVARAGVRAGTLRVGDYAVEERVVASVREITRARHSSRLIGQLT